MATAGQGTQFRRFNDTTKVWDVIAEVNSINGINLTREMIDTTALDTAGGYRTKIPSFRDSGSIDLVMNFTRDTFETMFTDFGSDTAVDYEIVFPDTDTTSYEIAGYVSSLSVAISTDDKITANVTITNTGQPNLESGSGPSAGV